MGTAKTQAEPSWDDLRVLLAVQRAGTFAAGARALRVDQATVGRRIAALERALGTKVFERLKSGLVLTPAGEKALAAASEMREASGRLRDAVDASEAVLSGVVRISAPESLTSGILAPALGALTEGHPLLRIALSSSQAPADLGRRDADVALRLFRPAQPTLVVKRIGRMAVGLYAGRAYTRRRGKVTLVNLSSHDLLGYDETLLTTPHGRWFAEAAGESRFLLRTNSTPALLEAARAGAGVALLPCFLANRYRELVRLTGPEDVPSPDLWLVAHEARRAIPRIRVVFTRIAGVLEAIRFDSRG